MEFTTERVGNALRIRLQGEIDHNGCSLVRARIDSVLEEEMPGRLLFNLSAVTFCDSSGLGLVMGRMRKCEQLGIALTVEEPSDAVRKILRIAGMDKLLQTERSNDNGKAS